VVVEFAIKPEFAGRFRERVQQQARDSLELESECHVFDVCIDPASDDVCCFTRCIASAVLSTHIWNQRISLILTIESATGLNPDR
jgi:hypothetical protein